LHEVIGLPSLSTAVARASPEIIDEKRGGSTLLSDNETDSALTQEVKSKKRNVNKNRWKCNVAKPNRNKGLE